MSIPKCNIQVSSDCLLCAKAADYQQFTQTQCVSPELNNSKTVFHSFFGPETKTFETIHLGNSLGYRFTDFTGRFGGFIDKFRASNRLAFVGVSFWLKTQNRFDSTLLLRVGRGRPEKTFTVGGRS